MRLWPLIAGGVAVGIAAAIYSGGVQQARAKLSTLGPEFNNLHPDVRERALRVIEEANAEFSDDGLTVGIYEGWRDAETQRRRIAAGVSQVSDPLDSFHAWGLAADFVFIDRLGSWTWLPDPSNSANTAYRDQRWYRLGAIIERNGFEWGGRWPWFDGPHGQLVLAKIAALKSNYGDPENFIATFA